MSGLARQAVLVLSGVFIVVAIMAVLTIPQRDAVAFLGGYLLFAVDIGIIAWIANALVRAQSASSTPTGWGGPLLIAALKFVLLAGGLYWMLVIADLSGLFVAAGALLALILICILACVHVLKSRVLKGFPPLRQ